MAAKSVSADTRIRCSSAALANMTSSLAGARPHSRTCTASRPEARRSVASRGAARYRSGISNGMRNRALALQSRRSGVAEALTNIIGLEVRILGQDLALGQTGCQHLQYGGYWNAQTPGARHASHL